MALRPALAPFATRSFRYQWPADLCTAWALEMETLILGWYVLVESGSVVLLTVFGALQFVGTLVSPVLGTVGDRIGLRNLLPGVDPQLLQQFAWFTPLAGSLVAAWWLGRKYGRPAAAPQTSPSSSQPSPVPRLNT